MALIESIEEAEDNAIRFGEVTSHPGNSTRVFSAGSVLSLVLFPKERRDCSKQVHRLQGHNRLQLHGERHYWNRYSKEAFEVVSQTGAKQSPVCSSSEQVRLISSDLRPQPERESHSRHRGHPCAAIPLCYGHLPRSDYG